MDRLQELLLSKSNMQPGRIVVAAAADLVVLKAIQTAVNYNLVIPILIGNASQILSISKEISFKCSDHEIIDEPDAITAASIAVEMIYKKKADILMKGLVPTGPLLKALIKKRSNLKINSLLSHFALFDSNYYHKLIAVTDAAMNIAPTVEEKADIIRNAVSVMQMLGVEKPKIAIVTPLEYVNKKIESTVHAEKLAQMNKDGIINGCIIEGPLALDNAICKEAAVLKGIKSEVAGDADIIIVHDLNTGNVFYKSLVFLGGASSASVITGARIPIVLTSRADSEKTKLMSIALATKIFRSTL